MPDVNLRFQSFHDEIEDHNKKIESIAKEARKLLLHDGGVRRIPTGVAGFDELVEGGVPAQSLILLAGNAGAGKSTFARQFLVEGAMNGEPGVYVTLQENPEEIQEQMRLFGWPVDDLIQKNMLHIVQPELYNYDALLTAIEDAIDRVKAKRLVVDSISFIGMYFEDQFKIRKALMNLSNLLKKLDCTTVAISEIPEGENTLSAYGVEEYVADSVIVLYFTKKGNMFIRAIAVRKMRSTKHSAKIHPVDIERPGGMVVYPSEEIFGDVS